MVSVERYMYVYIIVGLIAYLCGCISPSYIIAAAKKKDLRSNGSGNLGASNTAILLGLKWGIFVGFVDILKAFIPVAIMKYAFPQYVYADVICAVCAIIGHVFPFYFKFKGGKGTATYFGSMLGLSPLAFCAIGLIFLFVTYFTDFIAIGTFVMVCLFPVYLYFFYGVNVCLIMCIGSAIVAFKHRKNIGKIIRKEEIGLRAAVSGKHKL